VGELTAAAGGDLRTGHAREPTGGEYVHRSPDGLRAFWERLFSNDGGIPLEQGARVDTGRACRLEYDVVGWGRAELPPEAGVAVYARGESAKPAATGIYDDADPRLG
jgi:hypothetical protein